MARHRILLVDDDPVSSLIVARMASLLGLSWDIKSCSHPAQVFSLFSESSWRPDLALIDHFMPDLAGPALIDLLLQHGESLTWVGMSSSVEHNRWKGPHPAEAYFTKPINSNMLLICNTLAQLSRFQSQNMQLKSAI